MGAWRERIAGWHRRRRRRSAERKLAADSASREIESRPDPVPPALGPGKPSKRT